jgi:hypothetical protein
MSYTTTHLIVDNNNIVWTECPCCGEYLILDDDELNQYNNCETVSIECYECSTIFYLEK